MEEHMQTSILTNASNVVITTQL